jgi:preprotein translocase subunit SecA
MLGFLKKLFGGTKSEKDVATFEPIVIQINQAYAQLHTLSFDELRERTNDFRAQIKEFVSDIDKDIKNIGEKVAETESIFEKERLFAEVDALRKERDKALEVILKQILPEAFAVVKETSRRLSENPEIVVTATQHDRELAANPSKDYVRIEGDKAIWKNTWLAAGGRITWNMVHYDVQLIGGMVLHNGKIAEMQTGEGKTLVSTLPAYLNGLTGEGVHIITVNDYLARRDAEWNGPLFEFLLLTVDCIDKYKPNSTERKDAYLSDIVYGTNNEFGFDYLRDNMVREQKEQVQVKRHFAMVDEVDSVLIDDARTPLIISGPIQNLVDDQEYVELNPVVRRLIEAQQKLATQNLAEAKKLFSDGITGVEEGEAGFSLLRAHRAMPKNRALIKFMSEEGTKVLFQKTENHYMQEQSKRMKLIDVDLFFTIEEKTRDVQLTPKGANFLAPSNDPDFFLMPELSTRLVEIDRDKSLTKEEKTAAKERLGQDFAVKSRRLHAMSQLLKAHTLFEADQEYIVVDGEVKIVDEQTGRVMEGRRYSDGLHQALEAKEGVKVGELTQTYATITLQNYFRMYHKLAGMTGTAETEAKEFWDIYKLDVVAVPTNRGMTRKDLEDFVYKTTREKYNAVIDEIQHLTEEGRPVLVGTTSVDISEKLSRMLQLRGIKHNVLNAKQHQREAEIIASAGLPGAVTLATNMAGRGTDIKIGEQVRAAGGLAIIGTERHESRRVDRQLRGRAGRQGDPGTSQFFVSLEDNLMRLFQSERIAGVMDRLGHKEGDVIQHSMVTKSIENAQKKVEENNFGTRKRLLEYDDIMNIQRDAIYKKRKNALSGERLMIDLNQMFESETENLVVKNRNKGDYESFVLDSITSLGFDPEMDPNTFKTAKEDDVIDEYHKKVMDFYEYKAQRVGELLLPVISDVYKNEGHRYNRIGVPFSDGSTRPIGVSASLEDAVKSNGRSVMTDIEQSVMLSIIDEQWMEHLRNMDDLKESVQGASFEQKDPLVVYKKEAYLQFQEFIYTINEKVTTYLSKGILEFAPNEQVQEAREVKTNFGNTQTSRNEEDVQQQRSAAASASQQPVERVQPIVRQGPKVGRNDACPCGSGKKFKNCHGASL